MPLYVYQCRDCGQRFERRQRFADPAITRCPVCHQGRVQRVIGVVPVSFRGPGFYSTDNRAG